MKRRKHFGQLKQLPQSRNEPPLKTVIKGCKQDGRESEKEKII